MSSAGCVVIKHGSKRQLGPTPADVVVDVDVSLRRADITLRADECAGLCALLSAYVVRLDQPVVYAPEALPTVADNPIKPLFREDFWYFDGLRAVGENSSCELNFDILSGLLEQVKGNCIRN